MLKKLRALSAYHAQAAKHSLGYLCRKPVATLMTIAVIAIALALPALFWVCADNLGKLTASWQNSGHISLYLEPALTKEDQASVLETVRAQDGVGQATLTSSEDGLSELTQQEGMQDIMRYLPENPLPPVVEVVPASNIDSPAKLDLLSRQLEQLAHIDLVKLDMEWVRRLHAILDFASNLAHALIVLLALAVVFIIGNTLRLAIHNRQEEIQILKLIGATEPFILRPFLYTGVWYGLTGALVAVLLVNIFILSLELVVNQLAVVYQMSYPFLGLSVRQVLLLITFAAILGWLGAWLSVKRQLAVIEPYK